MADGSSATETLTGPDGAPLAVLIVEDEAILALELEAIVSDAGGLAIGPVATAAQAVRLTATLRPDVILMDIGLRDGFDGFEAAAVIRDSYPTPIVFVTAGVDARIHRRIAALSGFKLVRKPVDSAAVVRAIREAARAAHADAP